MSRTLTPDTRSGHNSGKRKVSADDLDEPTLVAGNEIVVYENQVPADKRYHWGYGFANREAGETSFVYADFQNSNDNAIDGELVLALTDSTGEDVLAKRYFQDLGDLRDAVNDDRTERIMMSEMQPAAREDRILQLRLVADSSSDGDDVSASNSDIKLSYGRVDA